MDERKNERKDGCTCENKDRAENGLWCVCSKPKIEEFVNHLVSERRRSVYTFANVSWLGPILRKDIAWISICVGK